MTKKQTETKKVTKTISKKAEALAQKEAEIEKAKKLLSKNGFKVAGDSEVIVDAFAQDFRSSVIILSVAINLVVFITWLILNLTTRYDMALVSAFLNR